MDQPASLLRKYRQMTTTFIGNGETNPNDLAVNALQNDISDLLILHYMAQRLSSVRNMLKQASIYNLPFFTAFEEGSEESTQQRQHRIVIYHDLPRCGAEDTLAFVGFISKRRGHLSPTIDQDIMQADQKMITELTRQPDLLSYSSMELQDGNWCNLVLFRKAEAKASLVTTNTHSHAAQQLAPRYYEWVRIHNGIVSGNGENIVGIRDKREHEQADDGGRIRAVGDVQGLIGAGSMLHLVKTKYYVF